MTEKPDAERRAAGRDRAEIEWAGGTYGSRAAEPVIEGRRTCDGNPDPCNDATAEVRCGRPRLWEVTADAAGLCSEATVEGGIVEV